jgi:cell wall-associated NlpC family hydrolase
MSIPVYGKKWNPSTHGPATGDYLLWSGAKTVSHNAKDAQAGDLCVWQTHMGIATGGGNMVSALNESLGTKATTISGGAPGGELLFVRRINGG